MTPKSNSIDESDEERYHQQQSAAPSHHPSPPPDELFDISTTVDPSYIISLIRKLIPTGTGNDSDARGVDGSDVGGKGSNDVHMEQLGGSKSFENGSEKMHIMDDFDKLAGDDKDSSIRCEQPGVAAGEEVWEDCGCILWDLAASRTHAELMVENLILEVLLQHLMVTESARIREICLGIIGNLACHVIPMEHIVSTNGLIGIIVDQLFTDDTQCLCEACRLLTSGLQGAQCSTWAGVLQPEEVLNRIIWVAGNTLNSQLLEKSVGLFLAILESQKEVSDVLLPSLMKLGLTNLLVSLLASEMAKLSGERVPERYSVLDVILRTIEALSTVDCLSQEICCNKELFLLVCDLVKLPDKAEVFNSCATAAVLIANILSDVPDFASDISHDLTFLQGLLDIFPLVSDDMEAQNALWSVTARLLVRVKEKEMDLSHLYQYVLVLVSKVDLIEDILLDQKFDNDNEDSKGSTTSDIKSTSRSITPQLRRIISILNKWTASMERHGLNDVMEERSAVDEDVARLLHCCCKHIQ
ncbi:ARM repeat superfamily protein [Euphorbia peplus]|nr:ARM repeat superfamily protein [Euphorbia peplus]